MSVRMGVGEGWQRALDNVENLARRGWTPAALERDGYQVVVSPWGAVFIRKPGDGVFEPRTDESVVPEQVKP